MAKDMLLPYAMEFASFLMQNISDKANIRKIILYGSVARGDAGKDSDIDLFIDLFKASKQFERSIANVIKRFHESQHFREKWKLMGIENEIDCKAGRLDEWKDLKQSIIANGITLFGKYEGSTDGKSAVLITWGGLKPEWKRVELSKKLYGYTYRGDRFPGLLEDVKGTKLGANCILVPVDGMERVISTLEKMGASPKRLHLTYSK